MDIVKVFTDWKASLNKVSESEWYELFVKAKNKNPWFTEENCAIALEGIYQFLDEEKLKNWLEKYNIQELHNPKSVGLVLAGNIPMVGFHDILCVLASGNQAMIKMSSKDDVLIPFLLSKLLEVEPSLDSFILYVEHLKDAEAIIATGGDNTSRYFEYYFRNKPHIIRKNRTSVAVLSGNETKEELHDLGRDITQYFGLGCRNVSKIYHPEGYEFNSFFESIEDLKEIVFHSKYVNNYDYNKSIFLVNKTNFLDNGFLLLNENEELVSPISTVYTQSYKDDSELDSYLETQNDKIQCIVSKEKDRIPFGKTQQPELWDYADNVDTMDFLISLS